MKYNELDVETWGGLDKSGDSISGYHGKFLTENDDESNLLVFLDEKKKMHFVASDELVKKSDIPDFNVSGLNIVLKKYKFRDSGGVKQFIDIECNNNAYVKEFTEIVREIAEKILVKKEENLKAISDVINAWKAFWKNQIKEILSEEEQIGLICELVVLKKLCDIDTDVSIDSWKGPLKEKYDFIFPEHALEVKGTRRGKHMHTINGLDQLKPPSDKRLILISFQATRKNDKNSKSLQDHVGNILNLLDERPDLVDRFYELLVGAGYSRVHSEKYRKIKFDIFDGRVCSVDENFPKLTPDDLKEPHDGRISDIRYNVDLSDLKGKPFEKENLEDYI